MSVAERLVADLTDPQPPALDALGKISEVAAEAYELAANPQAPRLASAFRAQLQAGQWTKDHETAFLRFVKGLAQQRSYLALREAADVVLDDEQTLGLAGQTLHDALLPNAEIITDSPLVAGLRLDIALEVVARTSVAPYQLLSLLTSSVQGYPEDFEDPLARAIGIAADIWTSPAEQQRFSATLAELAERGSEDAAYESAVVRLRDALTEQNKEDLLNKLRTARDHFDALAGRYDARDDAGAFAQTCTAVIAFEEADRIALAASAQAARTLSTRRALLVHGMHNRHQTTARRSAELAWTSLAWHLETAAIEIEEDSFLDTWVAVDALIAVYEADRQLTNLKTVSTLIRPRLVNQIARRNAMAHQLDRAVAIDRKRYVPELPQEIYELVDLVYRARSAGREPADDPEESSHDGTYLGALLGPATVVLDELSDSDRARLEEAARQSFVGTYAPGRPQNELIEGIVARLMDELEENEAFVGSTRANFSLLVLYTVRFLVYVGDSAQPYTSPIRPSDSTPLESELQKHFHQFLCATDLAGRVGMEHQNIAGGRADVITTFDGAQRYVTEVKRELNDAGREKLEKAYLAQALEYQSTSQPLGQLLVLDLTDHSSGTPHINDSIWVTHHRDIEGRAMSSAIVAVVRGNRPTPSSMH